MLAEEEAHLLILLGFWREFYCDVECAGFGTNYFLACGESGNACSRRTHGRALSDGLGCSDWGLGVLVAHEIKQQR